MSEIARMRFESAKSPGEKGEIVLTSDKMLRIEPSEEFSSELARLEEDAVHRSRAIGLGIGGVLITAGALFALVAWAAGRIAGRLRETIAEPKPVEQVMMFGDPDGGFHVQLPGTGLQKITLYWPPGETDLNEMASFMTEYRKLKGIES